MSPPETRPARRRQARSRQPWRRRWRARRASLTAATRSRRRAFGFLSQLVISGVEFVPSVIRSRDPYTGRFRVTDTRGYVVRDAIVLVTGVPLGWIQAPQEVRTNVDGLATAIQIQPTRLLRLVRSGSMVKFIRARKEGDSLLAGIPRGGSSACARQALLAQRRPRRRR